MSATDTRLEDPKGSVLARMAVTQDDREAGATLAQWRQAVEQPAHTPQPLQVLHTPQSVETVETVEASPNVETVRPQQSSPINPAPSRVKLRLIAADLGAATIGVMIAFLCQRYIEPVPRYIAADHLIVLAMSLPGFLLGAHTYRLYQARANERLTDEGANILKTVAMGVASVVLISFALQYNELSRLWVFLLALWLSIALMVERAMAREVFARLRREGKLVRRMVIVGTDAHALDLRQSIIDSPELGYRVVGLVGEDGEAGAGTDRTDIDADADIVGTTSQLFEILHREQASGVIISLGSMPSDQLNVVVRRLTDAGYHVAISSALLDIDPMRMQLQTIDGRSVIYVDRVIRDGWRSRAKRIYDIALSALILVLSSPILLVSAIAIKATSPGPVLFRQSRVGEHGRIFSIYKLRTMQVDAEARKAELLALNEADGPLFKMENDPRVTSVGRILRRLKIDELPQLYCVLRGTMSMVGPRPALPEEVAEWDDDCRERLRVPPGVTGMWQAFRGEATSFEQYKRLDLYYVDNWSLFHDIRICARTVSVVFNGNGAY
jgi:exopolysaccharide biosynthesis polyprenyl glycosylphosphotransferase